MVRDNLNLDRRSVLKSTGALAGAGLLAGCSSGGSSGDSGGSSGGSSGDSGGSSGGSSGSSGSSGSGGGSDFPSDTLNLIIPYGTGGGFNAYTRLVAKHMADHVDVTVKPENVTGGGGRVATEQVYRSEPDGYTSMLMYTNSVVWSQILEDVKYDVTKFTYFPQVATSIASVAVGTNTDIDTFDDYVNAVQNDELFFTASGPAESGIVQPVLLGEMSGLYPAEKVTGNFVQFDSRGSQITAIKRGDAQVMGGSVSALLPYVKSGDLKFVTAFTNEDQPPSIAPEGTATLKTAGVNNADKIARVTGAQRVFTGPPDIPSGPRDKLRELYTKTIQSDALQQEAKEIDRPIRYKSSEEAQQAAVDMYDAWQQRSDLLNKLVNSG